MALWGVTGSDVKSVGMNAMVEIGVAAGCAGLAALIKKVLQVGLKNRTLTDRQQGYCTAFSMFVGFLGAYAAHKHIPASRFSLIPNLHTSSLVKLGAILTLFGLAIDHLATKKDLKFTGFGFTFALANYFINYGVLGVGMLGAYQGAHLIPSVAK